MALDIDISQKPNGHLIVSLSGRLDSETTPECEKKIAPLLASAKEVVFDLRALEYISSAGLRLVLVVRKTAAKKGDKVALRNMRPPVAKVFEIANLIPSDVAANERSADIYLEAIQRKESAKSWDMPA